MSAHTDTPRTAAPTALAAVVSCCSRPRRTVAGLLVAALAPLVAVVAIAAPGVAVAALVTATLAAAARHTRDADVGRTVGLPGRRRC